MRIHYRGVKWNCPFSAFTRGQSQVSFYKAADTRSGLYCLLASAPPRRGSYCSQLLEDRNQRVQVRV